MNRKYRIVAVFFGLTLAASMLACTSETAGESLDVYGYERGDDYIAATQIQMDTWAEAQAMVQSVTEEQVEENFNVDVLYLERDSWKTYRTQATRVRAFAFTTGPEKGKFYVFAEEKNPHLYIVYFLRMPEFSTPEDYDAIIERMLRHGIESSAWLSDGWRRVEEVNTFESMRWPLSATE